MPEPLAEAAFTALATVKPECASPELPVESPIPAPSIPLADSSSAQQQAGDGPPTLDFGTRRIATPGRQAGVFGTVELGDDKQQALLNRVNQLPIELGQMIISHVSYSDWLILRSKHDSWRRFVDENGLLKQSIDTQISDCTAIKRHTFVCELCTYFHVNSLEAGITFSDTELQELRQAVKQFCGLHFIAKKRYEPEIPFMRANPVFLCARFVQPSAWIKIVDDFASAKDKRSPRTTLFVHYLQNALLPSHRLHCQGRELTNLSASPYLAAANNQFLEVARQAGAPFFQVTSIHNSADKNYLFEVVMDQVTAVIGTQWDWTKVSKDLMPSHDCPRRGIKAKGETPATAFSRRSLGWALIAVLESRLAGFA